jgi:hypothetical protein
VTWDKWPQLGQAVASVEISFPQAGHLPRGMPLLIPAAKTARVSIIIGLLWSLLRFSTALVSKSQKSWRLSPGCVTVPGIKLGDECQFGLGRGMYGPGRPPATRAVALSEVGDGDFLIDQLGRGRRAHRGVHPGVSGQGSIAWNRCSRGTGRTSAFRICCAIVG